MWIFRVILFGIILCVSFAEIPYDELNIQLIDDRGDVFESTIRNALTTTKNFFARDEVKMATSAAGKILSFVPYLKEVGALLPVIQEALASESDWKEPLANAIPDQTKRAIAMNDIRDMQAGMRTIQQNVRFLNEGADDFTSQSKITIVHNIHDDVDKVVNKFSHQEAIFRKYPLLAIPTLFAFSTFITIFDPIENTVVPALAKRSFLSCKLVETLLEYRKLAVRSRLDQLTIHYVDSNELEISTMIGNVVNREYNEYGYNQSNYGTILCNKGCVKADYRVCLKDHLDNSQYDCGRYTEMHGCIFGYMEMTRYRIEKAFKDPIEMVDKTCKDIIRDRPRNPTGFGYLTISVEEVWAHNAIGSDNCDNFYFGAGVNPCDPYVKIYIDNRQVFRTSIKEQHSIAHFHETYKSDRIKKTAQIKFEVWDDDSGSFGWSNDDLIGAWTTSIDNLVGDRKFGDINSLKTKSSWKDEYDDE